MASGADHDRAFSEGDGYWADEGAQAYPDTAGQDRTVAEVAREFGLTLRALRFYEQKRLLAPRRVGAARLYDRSERERLALLIRARKLGFTLGEIRRMLDTPAGGAGLAMSRRQCFEQINLLEERKREIEGALAKLRRAYSSFYVRFADPPTA